MVRLASNDRVACPTCDTHWHTSCQRSLLEGLCEAAANTVEDSLDSASGRQGAVAPPATDELLLQAACRASGAADDDVLEQSGIVGKRVATDGFSGALCRVPSSRGLGGWLVDCQ
eukprot:5706061-Alexandrium_andersonii.AAC.1